jgi:hypothetical protein
VTVQRPVGIQRRRLGAKGRGAARGVALGRLDPGDRGGLAVRHFEEPSSLEVAALRGVRPAASGGRLEGTLDGDLSRREGGR